MAINFLLMKSRLLLNIEFFTNKGIGEGIFECRIDFGPGYRIYFGKDGDTIVILLGGGTKKRQQKDIVNAKKFWKEYKLRKRQEQ